MLVHVRPNFFGHILLYTVKEINDNDAVLHSPCGVIGASILPTFSAFTNRVIYVICSLRV